MSIKLSANEMRLIALFENTTGAMVKDCIIDDENSKVIFIVKNGNMGLAIGKGGASVSKVKRAVGRDVEIVELSDDPCQFIENLLAPAEVDTVKITTSKAGDKVAVVTADNTNKRIAIGKSGNNIKKAKLIANRLHEIGNIILK